jgi:hypothetical protein
MEEDKIPPLLSGLKKNREAQLGKMPPGYFDHFESDLRKKIDEAPKDKKIRQLNSNYIMAIAASLLLLIIVGLWYVRGSNPMDYSRMMALNIEKKLQGIETREMNEYLLAEIDAIDTEDLTEGIDLENMDFVSSEKGQIFLSDSLSPPKKDVQIIADPKNPTAENPEKEELLNSVADDSNLEELLLELDDEDFKALEQSLLKGKKKPN